MPPPGRPSRRAHGIATLVLGTVLAIPCAAAPPGAGRASETIDVVEIEVPVQVLVDGEPVRGLTRDDFTIVAAGRKRPILGFSAVDLGAPTPVGEPVTAAAPPLAARRHVLLLFDLTFADPAKTARARDAAVSVVRGRLHPSDLVSVATFSLGGGVEVLLEFTPDHRQVEETLLHLGRHDGRILRDPLGLVFLGPGGSSVAPGPVLAGTRGGEGDALLQSQIERNSFVLLGHAYEGLSAALRDLAASLRTIAGQKQVFYLSEGADSSPLLGVGRGVSAEERRQIQATNEAAMRGEVWSVESDTRFGTTHTLVDFESMLQEFVRAGATLQTVDVGGLRADGGGAPGDDTLFLMADETGGQYVRNHNDLERAMATILERTAVTYLLTFAAPAEVGRGSFERIKVKLARPPRGARLFHRPGYFAPLPFAERSAVERRAEAAQWLLDDRVHDEIGFEARVDLASPGSGDDVTIELAVRRADLPLAAGEPVTVEFYGYAFAPDGRVAGYFERTVTVSPAEATGDDGTVRVRAGLALPPGSYDLRLLARETTLGAVATRSQRLAVATSGG